MRPRSPRFARPALLLALLPGLGASAPATPGTAAPGRLEADVVVYGGTAAGVIAAYTARQYGRRVLLVEPGRHLGGMTSGGLGFTDIGNKYAVSGLGLEFYRRVGQVYGQFEVWQFEPKVAEQVLERFVNEADVEVLFSRRVRSVQKRGAWIRTITLEYAGRATGAPPQAIVVTAKQFIDASYEGDLMARAGASYVVGREPDERYGETLDGYQLRDKHQFPDGVDPYVVPGRPESGLLPEIGRGAPRAAGAGDRQVQAYNFRMALCQGDQRIPMSRPAGYDSTRYALLLRLMAARPWRTLDAGFKIDRMPNGKSDWNNNGAFSTDFIGQSWDYPDASYARRDTIRAAHARYQKGLLWFVASDPRVPEPLRAEMQRWGWCRDEFLDTGGWPHQLYVREARRLVGEYVMTEHEVTARRVVPDGIALAAYGMDSHNTQRLVVGGTVRNEGDVQVGGFAPYPIAYRAITPRRAEVANLLVPVALSASHIAYGSIRMEPVFMVLGQAAAVAASQAIDANVPVQRVNVAAVQRELRENPLADGSTPEVLVDDAARDGGVAPTGAFVRGPARGSYGPTLLRADSGRAGTVRFTPDLRAPGRYALYLYWPRGSGAAVGAGGALASNASVVIQHADGSERLVLDQRTPTQNAQGGLAAWTRLGEFRFEAGRGGSLTLVADGANGAVLADAALWVPVRHE